VIDPLNTAFHRHVPLFVESKDLDSLLHIYATDTGDGLTWSHSRTLSDTHSYRRVVWIGPAGEEPIAERYRKLLSLFSQVEDAELRIHRVGWREADPDLGYPSQFRLIVRGRNEAGERIAVDQRAEVSIVERDGEWLITRERVVERELVSSREPAFELATESLGVVDVHDTTDAPAFRLVGDTSISSGSAAADVDCDGLEDIVLLSSNRVSIYHNRGDGRFSDASAAMGLAIDIDIAGTGLVPFDADNDGDADLWLSGVRGDRFYRNEGCRRYVDVTVQAGLGATRWSSMPIVADYDLDGHLDVYVVRMGDHAHGAPRPNWQARNGERDSLYRNNGDGTFSDVTRKARLDARGWGLAGAWGDYDGNGYPDIYVGNEFGLNSLYRNNGDGTFTDVAKKAGVLDRGAAMGVDWGDYDNDGDLDLFVNNMYANSRWALVHPDYPPPVPWYFSWVPRVDVDTITDELTRGSSLLRNEGDGTFTDVSDAVGVRDCQWGWSAKFMDYDNDGWLDLYAANGFVSGPVKDDV
jgi:hypothetical protein